MSSVGIHQRIACSRLVRQDMIALHTGVLRTVKVLGGRSCLSGLHLREPMNSYTCRSPDLGSPCSTQQGNKDVRLPGSGRRGTRALTRSRARPGTWRARTRAAASSRGRPPSAQCPPGCAAPSPLETKSVQGRHLQAEHGHVTS